MSKDERALLVMDFQHEIVAMTAAGGSAEAVQRVREAVEACRTHGVAVVFVRVAYREGHVEAAPTNKRVTMLKEKGLHLDADEGSGIVAGTGIAPGDAVVVKRRVGAFSHTDLQPLLNALGVRGLVLAGLSTSGVVLSTVRQAADLEYGITVLEDACADGDRAVHEMLMSKVFPPQCEIISTAAFVAEVSSPGANAQS